MVTFRAAAEDERNDSMIPGVFPLRRVRHVGRLHYRTDRHLGPVRHMLLS